MTILETSAQNGVTRVSRVVALSPEALRAAADTLESLARNGCNPGDAALYQLTPGITVLYKPDKYQELRHDAVHS